MAPADGALRWIEIQLVNDGNSEEAFDLSIAADWRLGLEMNAEQTLGIDPFGGDTSVLLMFPMPYGIENETYQIWVNLYGDAYNVHSWVALLSTTVFPVFRSKFWPFLIKF